MEEGASDGINPIVLPMLPRGLQQPAGPRCGLVAMLVFFSG